MTNLNDTCSGQNQNEQRDVLICQFQGSVRPCQLLRRFHGNKLILLSRSANHYIDC